MTLKNILAIIVFSFSLSLNSMEMPGKKSREQINECDNQNFGIKFTLEKDANGIIWAIPAPIAENKENDSLIDQMLLDAAKKGEVEFVIKLIGLDANLEIKDKYGRTPLMLAAITGHLEVAKFLIIGKADFDNMGRKIYTKANFEAKDEYGRTPLMLASMSGSFEIVELLVRLGANFEVKDNGGRTPLMLASINGHLKIVQLLMKKASLNQQDLQGKTAFLLALMAGHTPIAKELLQAGTDISLKDVKGLSGRDYIKFFSQK